MITTRPAGASDQTFVAELARESHAARFAVLDLPAAELDQLLDLQVDAQRAQYTSTFPNATDHVIEHDGSPVGRLLVDRSPGAVRIIDIVVAQSRRGHGIGGAALTAVLADADQTGSDSHLSVAVANPAQRLYERLGFQVTGTDGVHHTMWRPAAPPSDDLTAQHPTRRELV